MKEKKTLLMLATYGLEMIECGGTLAKHAQAGDSVFVTIALSRPEYRDQVRRAAALLGVEVSFLDFQYGELEATVHSKIKLVKVIRDIRPQIVITQDPEHSLLDLDPDRREAMTLYLEAVALASREWRVSECGPPHLISSLYFMTPEHPTCLVDISDVFHLKEQALAELHGQLMFTAKLFRWRVSERALRSLLPEYDRIKEDPLELGRALHREMNRSFHLAL